MRYWVTGGVTALGVLVLLASCRDPTEFTLELSTDLPCAELGDTSIYVGTAQQLAGPIGSLTPSAVTRGCKDGKGRIGSIVVVPSGSEDERVSIRVVAGRTNASCAADLHSGCIEARRSLGFVPHTPLYVPIELARSCENVVCDNASDTCVSGQCVPSAIECNGACPTPGIDAGAVDATYKDVLVSKDVISISDAIGLDDSPITVLDAAALCTPPVPDAGVSTYTWHFDGSMKEAGGLLPAANLPGGASFVPGPVGCGSALSPGGNGISLGASAQLAAAFFRVDLYVRTTTSTGPILSVQDAVTTTMLWGLTVQNGMASAVICASSCILFPSQIAINDGVLWHRLSFSRVSGGQLTLVVDGKSASTNLAFNATSTNAALIVPLVGALDELHFTAN